VASKHVIKSTGYGKMALSALTESNKVVRIVLDRVLIVPNLSHHPFSVRQATSSGGAEVLMRQGGGLITIFGK